MQVTLWHAHEGTCCLRKFQTLLWDLSSLSLCWNLCFFKSSRSGHQQSEWVMVLGSYGRESLQSWSVPVHPWKCNRRQWHGKHVNEDAHLFQSDAKSLLTYWLIYLFFLIVICHLYLAIALPFFPLPRFIPHHSLVCSVPWERGCVDRWSGFLLPSSHFTWDQPMENISWEKRVGGGKAGLFTPLLACFWVMIEQWLCSLWEV